jgi:hypothetical protein
VEFQRQRLIETKIKEIEDRKRNKRDMANAEGSLSSQSSTSASCMSCAEDRTACILYGEYFEQNWIQCQRCEGWFHDECEGAEYGAFYYICDMCHKGK